MSFLDKYEANLPVCDSALFEAMGGVEFHEWFAISSMARALRELSFVGSSILDTVKTKKCYYESRLADAKRDLSSALCQCIIEVEERRVVRKMGGYADRRSYGSVSDSEPAPAPSPEKADGKKGGGKKKGGAE